MSLRAGLLANFENRLLGRTVSVDWIGVALALVGMGKAAIGLWCPGRRRGCSALGTLPFSDRPLPRASRWSQQQHSYAGSFATDGSTVTLLRHRPAARPSQARPPRPAALRSP